MGRVISVALTKKWSWEDSFDSEFGCTAVHGKKVVIIDSDPQGNATSGVACKKEAEQDVYDVLVNQVPMADVIVPTTRKLGVVLLLRFSQQVPKSGAEPATS